MSASPQTVTRALVTIAVSLLGLHLFALFLDYGLGHPRALGFVPAFHLGLEHNVPTLFSALLMLLIAHTAWENSAAQAVYVGSGQGYWVGIAVIFLFLAVDEVAQFHESLNEPVRNAFAASGALFFAWVIPYGVAVGALAIAYARFVWRLPSLSRALTFAGAALYLSGAIGMELINGAYYQSVHGVRDLTYTLMVTVEETLEMLGLVVFVRATMEVFPIRPGVLESTPA